MVYLRNGLQFSCSLTPPPSKKKMTFILFMCRIVILVYLAIAIVKVVLLYNGMIIGRLILNRKILACD